MDQPQGAARKYICLPLHLRIHDQRIYVISRRTATDLIYLRCRNHGTCPGTAKIYTNNVDIIIPTRDHSEHCEKFENVEMIARFRDALREALRFHWYKLSSLYDTLVLLYQEASMLVPFSSIRTSMRRWRRRSFPPNPRNLEDFGLSLFNVHDGGILDYNTGRLRTVTLLDDNGNSHVVFYDLDFMRAEFENVTSILVDATFDCVPQMQNAMQLLTIMGIRYNHAIPIFWAVMSRKTQVAYTVCLTFFRNIIRYANIEVIMCDFEVALRNACRQIYPRSRIAGCNVHFDRAIYHKLQELGLRDRIRNDADVSRAVKKIIALPFLPHEDIEPTFRDIVGTLTRRVRNVLRPFISYFQRQWIQAVSPQGFCIFGLQRRTNNAIESYHSRINNRMGRHPSPWDFVCHLLHIQEGAVADVTRLSNGLQVRRVPRYAARFREIQLNRIWRLYANQSLTKEELLTIVTQLKGNIARKMEVWSRIDDELRLRYEEEFINPNNVNGMDPEFDFNVINAQRFNERDVVGVRRFVEMQLNEAGNAEESKEEVLDSDHEPDDPEAEVWALVVEEVNARAAEIAAANQVPVGHEVPDRNQVPAPNEIHDVNELPIRNQVPDRDQVPVRNEASAPNVVPIANEVPVPNEVPIENEVPGRNQVPVENEAHASNEVRVGNEVPVTNQVPLPEDQIIIPDERLFPRADFEPVIRRRHRRRRHRRRRHGRRGQIVPTAAQLITNERREEVPQRQAIRQGQADQEVRERQAALQQQMLQEQEGPREQREQAAVQRQQALQGQQRAEVQGAAQRQAAGVQEPEVQEPEGQHVAAPQEKPREEAPHDQAAQPEQLNSLCACCLTEDAKYAFAPCGHKCACFSCARRVLNSNKKCPYCRVTTLAYLRIFEV